MLPTVTNPVLALSIFSALFAFSCAQTYDFGRDVSRLTRRQDATAPVVVGKLPLAANGSVPRRLEIRQMKTYPHKWDLFILALSMFQSADQDDTLSWYQIAGIHGVPFIPWDNVAPVPGASMSGYCTHSSVLFPMWHRPYLALFEQQMYKMANAIAGMFPNATQRQSYQQAASDFRVPYWDWSRSAPPGQTHFPDMFWSPIIVQNGPNGAQNIRNPLYSYQFHPLDVDALIWNPLKQWNETKRGPELNVSLTAPPSNNERVNSALLSKLPEIQQRLYILFSSYHDFNSFSNKAWSASHGLTTMDSIESIHDIIHIYGGSKGHMTYVPLSSFDPLFFLHHLMTDRLVAIWQILNPSAWITPMPAGETSFTAVKGSMQSSDTPLTPFRSSPDGMFWNSDTSRSTEEFGYTYADTDASLGSGDDLRQSLVQKINDWYGASSPVGMMAKAWRAGAHHGPHGGALKRQLHTDKLRPNVKLTAANPPTSQILQDGHYTEWIANVQVNVEALDGCFGIHFFFGQPPAIEANWELARNHAGSVNIFAMNRSTGSESKISGAVPLTSALMKLAATGAVRDLSPTVVTPFLEAALQFRVLGSDDKTVDPRLVDGLYVSISSSSVRVPGTDRELPAWGPAVARLVLWTGRKV